MKWLCKIFGHKRTIFGWFGNKAGYACGRCDHIEIVESYGEWKKTNAS